MQSEEGANMTKDEWQEAERRALWKYGGLTLLVDGYKIMSPAGSLTAWLP